MIKLQIKNFQKITDANIMLKGFSIIRGESNLGKSSIARAIESVVFGGFKGLTDSKSGYLKKGAKECEIKLEQNGNVITIIKSKSKNQYIVNGVDLPKGGRGVPEQIRELGYSVLANGVNLNMAKQHSPLFIVGETETDITKSINSVFKVQLFEVAISKILKNKKETTLRETILRESLLETKKQISQLEVLRSLLEAKQTVEDELELLNQYEDDMTTLKDYTETNRKLIDTQSCIRLINIIDEYKLNSVEMKIHLEAVEPIQKSLNILEELEQVEDFIIDKEELIDAKNIKDDLSNTVELLDSLRVIYYYLLDKYDCDEYKRDKSETDVSLLEITNELKKYTCKSCNQIIRGQ